MKKIILAILFGAITSIGFTQNLITNGTFEDDSMELNCEGWFGPYGESFSTITDSIEICDTRNFSQSDENNWSLMIFSSFPGPYYAETYITGREGTHIYELKYDMLGEGIGLGTGYFGKLVNDEFERRKSITDTASNWRTFNLTDTITTQPTDTIVVGFAGDDCDICFSTAFFDNISFSTDIIPVSTKYIEKIDLRKISIYPNPTIDYLIFKLDPSLGLNSQLFVYDSLGRLIETAPINKSVHKLNTSFLSSGLYYYRLEDKLNKQLSGLGKFIVE